MNHVFTLAEAQYAASQQLVGPKAFHLSEVIGLDLPVPLGFVLSAELHRLRGAMELRSLIEKNLKNLKSPKIIVRSSGLLEDGDSKSYAGQFESFVVSNKLEKVISGIEACWDSASSLKLSTYDESNPNQVIGVIVQEYIEPDYAGVVFTSAPDQPKMGLVEYVEGSGDKLMSGRATPRSYYLQSDEPNIPFASPLRAAVKKIQEFYGKHQDIEWVFYKNALAIVQTRPITKLTNPICWSSVNLNENYPRQVSPLLYSIARLSYYHYFKSLCQAFSLPGLAEAEPYFANVVGKWGGKIYYNMSSIAEIIKLTPFAPKLAGSFDNFVGYRHASSALQPKQKFSHQAVFLMYLLYHACLLPFRVRSIEKTVDRMTADSLASDQQGFHAFLDIRFYKWRKAAFADFYAMVSHGGLQLFISRWLSEEGAGVHNTLVQSIPKLVSNQPIFALWRLRLFIEQRNYGQIFKKFDADEDKVWEFIQTSEHLQDLRDILEDYIKRWGFRCSGELMLQDPNYQDQPSLFIRLITGYLASERADPQQIFLQKNAEQKAVLAKLRSGLRKDRSIVKGYVLATGLSLLTGFARYAISCRERVRLKQAHMYATFRRYCLNIGRDLAKVDVLESPADIFFLEYSQIAHILGGSQVNRNELRNAVNVRKQAQQDANDYPESFICDNSGFREMVSPQSIASEDQQGVFRGIPACGGLVTGRAIVIDSIHQIDQIKKGDVLVTKQTDPGWICAFPLISGLVVERGGMLSHGAIVAREFGIPAVVGLEQITEKIHTGDMVTVEGFQGVVTC